MGCQHFFYITNISNRIEICDSSNAKSVANLVFFTYWIPTKEIEGIKAGMITHFHQRRHLKKKKLFNFSSHLLTVHPPFDFAEEGKGRSGNTLIQGISFLFYQWKINKRFFQGIEANRGSGPKAAEVNWHTQLGQISYRIKLSKPDL
jgi:hypothetical protein